MIVEFSLENSAASSVHPSHLNTLLDGLDIVSQSNVRGAASKLHDAASFQTTTTLIGTPANDIIRGRASDDLIRGLGGNDRLFGQGGNDTVRGDQGNDALIGGSGKDQLIGGNGNDTLEGSGGRDRLKGNGGDDLLDGGGSADVLQGGAGQDVLDGGSGKDVLNGGGGDDILVARKKDKIKGGAGNNIFWDLGKKNTFIGGVGKDEFHFIAQKSSTSLNNVSVIERFQPNKDVLYFSNREITDVSELILSNQGFDTLISTDGGPRLLLKAISPDRIRSKNIQFDTELTASLLSTGSASGFSSARLASNFSFERFTSDFSASDLKAESFSINIRFSQPVAIATFSRGRYELQSSSSNNNFSIRSVNAFGQIAASISVPSLSEGEYQLTISATDLASNEVLIPIRFRVIRVRSNRNRANSQATA